MQLMKGYTFQEAVAKGKVQYPVQVEPKIDDIRCQVLYTPNDIEEPVQYLSYAGKPLHNMWFLSRAMQTVFEHTGYTELDIGIEVNGNFNDSYRWVRSKNGPPKEKLDKATGKVAPALDAGMVHVHLFDIPQHPGTLDERQSSLVYVDALLDSLRVRSSVSCLGSEECLTEADVYAEYENLRQQGYEGAMVKDLHSLYERKRSWAWLKLKPSAEADGVITALNRGTSIHGEPLDRCTSIQITMPDGSIAEPHGISHTLGALMHKFPEDYIGRHATFKYMERDRQGGYRHPTFERIREEK